MPITINGTGTITGLSVGGIGASVINSSNVVDATLVPGDLAQPLTAATAQATTSGTSIDFTSIPSWVKRITVMFNEVSTNGTSGYRVQVGDGSITTSGYLGSGSRITDASASSVTRDTSGFRIQVIDATCNLVGSATITNMGSNRWVFSFAGGDSNTDRGYFSGGMKLLTGVLDRIRLTTVNGTDTFDAGSVNILYE